MYQAPPIRGKQGRFRQNIMWRRVNYGSRRDNPRSIAAPWEVGVPVAIATELGIVDGDTCIMNRQPSLHRGSLMAHAVYVGHAHTKHFTYCNITVQCRF